MGERGKEAKAHQPDVGIVEQRAGFLTVGLRQEAFADKIRQHDIERHAVDVTCRVIRFGTAEQSRLPTRPDHVQAEGLELFRHPAPGAEIG